MELPQPLFLPQQLLKRRARDLGVLHPGAQPDKTGLSVPELFPQRLGGLLIKAAALPERGVLPVAEGRDRRAVLALLRERSEQGARAFFPPHPPAMQ